MGTQGFSQRTRRDARTVRLGAETARVDVVGMVAERRFTTAVTVTARGSKRVVLDGAPLRSSEDLRRRLPVLAFTPDRLAVVKGGPVVRRAYLDRVLGRVFPARANLPGAYVRALAQRNAALRRIRDGESSPAALAPWSAALARLGTELDAVRAATASALAPAFRELAASLGLEDASLAYDAPGLAVEELDARVGADLRRGTTGVGPHLREIAITAAGRDLRSFGSQGEQRVAVLSLLLAEASVVGELAGEPPLLLLDDVLSELDDERRRALLADVPQEAQTVVTATSLRALPPSAEPAQVVEVRPGVAILR